MGRDWDLSRGVTWLDDQMGSLDTSLIQLDSQFLSHPISNLNHLLIQKEILYTQKFGMLSYFKI